MISTVHAIRFWILLGAILVLPFLGIKVVFADTFYPLGNIEDSAFHYIVGMAIQSLPANSAVYNETLIHGIKASQIDSLDYAGVKLDPFLYSQFTSGVKVPAGSSVSLHWLPYNNTGHAVYIHGSWLFSDNIVDTGLNPIVNRSLLYYAKGSSENKVGLSYQFGGFGNIPIGMSGKRSVFTYNVEQPLRIVSASVVIEDADIEHPYHYALTIENTSSSDEYATVSGNKVRIDSGKTVTVTGSVRHTSNLPANITVNGRLLWCIADSADNHIFAISRNDQVGNWFWGGIQFEDAVVNSADNYCVSRIDTAIPVLWVGSVDTVGTYGLAVANDVSITPPQTYTLAYEVNREGGTKESRSELAIRVDPTILKYASLPPAATLDGNNLIIAPVYLQPNENKKVSIDFSFPSVLPENEFGEHTVVATLDGGKSVSTTITIQKRNEFTVSVAPVASMNNCGVATYSVTIEQLGNYYESGKYLSVAASSYTKVLVEQAQTGNTVSYELTEGTHLIYFFEKSTLKIMMPTILTINGIELKVPPCVPPTISSLKSVSSTQRIRAKPITRGTATNLPVQVKSEIKPIKQQSNNVLGTSVQNIPNKNQGTRERIVGYLLVTLMIGSMAFQLYRKVVPRKR